jgi:hypothetical protein
MTFMGYPVQIWHSLSDEHYASLGRVAFFAGLLEGATYELARALVAGGEIEDDNADHYRADAADVVVGGMGFTPMVDLCSKLLQRLDADFDADIRGLQAARDHMSRRNDALHGFWVEQTVDAEAPTSVIRKRGTTRVVQTTVHALDELAADLANSYTRTMATSAHVAGHFRAA